MQGKVKQDKDRQAMICKARQVNEGQGKVRNGQERHNKTKARTSKETQRKAGQESR